MKILVLIWISSFVLFSPNCNNKQSDKTPNSTQNQSSMINKTYNYENRTEDLEYKIQAQLKKRKSAETNAEESYIAVNYTIKNHSKKNYILFNRGHSTESNPQQIYAEFQDGVAELSQKAFAEPTDTVCPARDAPILPRATHLKVAQTISGQAEIILPLEWNTPFDDCYKKEQRKTPSKIKGFKFCLGVVEIGNVEIDDKGYISLQYSELQELIGKQQLLCSDTIELE